MMDKLPTIEEMYGTKRADAPAVDKQDLILRALATLLRMAATDRLERVAAPYGDEHVARATKLITEIDGVVK